MSTNNNSAVILKACKCAAEWHSGQRRKDIQRTPYINHPLEVAEFLTSNGVTDLDTIVAAILHDVIEDTEGTSEQIKQMFGDKVLEYVLDCSDNKSLDKVQRKRLQIVHAGVISPQAKLVKLADKYSNVKDLLTNQPIGWTPEIVKGYVHWSMAVCRRLYGVNSEIDAQLNDLFKKHNVDVNMTDDDLNKHLEIYYESIL
jgi:guanosine-3',5'-bis(diphosphate) 3'-pyrophosphohydrolase